MSERPRIRVNKYGPVSDGFSNVIAGIGAANPKMAAAQYAVGGEVLLADAAFRTSTWYGKILTIPVDDSVRMWRSWKASPGQIERIEAEENRVNYRIRAREALLMSRHEGGALIVPGGLPGSNSSALDLGRIAEGQITHITVLSKDEVSLGPIVRNPRSPNYGMPEFWGIAGDDGSRVELHVSRAFPINGRHVPGGTTRRMEFWGDSIWLHLADSVIAADSGAAIISALLSEAKLDIVSVPDMAMMMSTPEGSASLTRRWQLAAQLKSVAGIMLIDGGPQVLEGNSQEEKWQQKQIRWDGLPDVQRMLLTVLSGAADIPYTRLTGDQQSGLSNNDDGSMKNYHSTVNTRQVLEIEPMIRPLDEILIRSALGSRDKKIWYTWNKLDQLSEKEASEIDKLDAETTEILANTAMVDPDKLAEATVNRMIESGRWPGLEAGDVADDPGIAPGSEATLPEGGAAAALQGRPQGLQTRPKLVSSRDAALADATPRSLYVSRTVVNAREILAHYRAAGVTDTVTEEDLHVTVIYSRVAVDWMSVSESWSSKIEIGAGGARLMDRFGPEGAAKVLLFRCSELEWRHQAFVDAGAVSSHSEYQPHITISYGDMPDGVEPWEGHIVLGPEVFREVVEDWSKER